MKTKIVTISDTHNRHNDLTIPNGEIIIHAGDFSNRGTKHEMEEFTKWYGSLPHANKVLIAGNHDKGTDPAFSGLNNESLSEYFKALCSLNNITLLEDSFCEIYLKSGDVLKIWGSPVQPTFGYGWAWNRNRGKQIQNHWDKIPEGMDIIVTHGPAYGFGDKCNYGDRVGCEDLLEAIERVKPKLHVFGHIHEDRGIFTHKNGIVFNNASSLTLRYEPYQENSFVFEWESFKSNS